MKQLKKKKEHYATKAVDNNEKQCRTMRGFNISNYGLKTEIKQMEEEIETLKAQIKQLPDKIKINEMLEENEGRLEIRFHTMSTRRENKSLEELCGIVNKEKFLYPGTKLKLVFKAA